MKIQLISDVHMEHRSRSADHVFFKSFVLDEKPDLLIVAGDFCELKEAARCSLALQELSKNFTDIIWVFGNHEYYGINPKHVTRQLNEIKPPSNIEVVSSPRTIKFKDRKICCGTMWYSVKEVKATGCVDYKSGTWMDRRSMVEFSDFYKIRHLYPWVYEQNNKFNEMLDQDLEEGAVVVSHHLPSNLCVSQRYLGEVSNCFFVDPHDEIIRERKPAAWLFGHTHNSFDFMLGDTVVKCNPTGYPGHFGHPPERPEFDAKQGWLEV